MHIDSPSISGTAHAQFAEGLHFSAFHYSCENVGLSTNASLMKNPPPCNNAFMLWVCVHRACAWSCWSCLGLNKSESVWCCTLTWRIRKPWMFPNAYTYTTDNWQCKQNVASSTEVTLYCKVLSPPQWAGIYRVFCLATATFWCYLRGLLSVWLSLCISAHTLKLLSPTNKYIPV